MQQNDFGSSRPSRRVILGALAATTALAGCTSKDDGYGAPIPDSAAGKTNRAFFVLWLLLTTNPDYFQILLDTTANTSTVTPASDLSLDNLVKDLKYFFDGTPADQKQAINTVMTYIGNNFEGDYAKTPGDGGKVIPVEINYGTALRVVNKLFQNLGSQSSPKHIHAQSGGGFYTGPSGSCPADIKELLSIATDNPVTSNPTVRS